MLISWVTCSSFTRVFGGRRSFFTPPAALVVADALGARGGVLLFGEAAFAA